MPLVKRPSDLLYAALTGAERVLDVGAGDDTRRRRIAARAPGASYVSVDPDEAAGADHASLDEVEGPFDVAIVFEVLEHMAPEAGVTLLGQVRERLRPGGRVFVSVPCTLTPGRFLRDCTHVTPWAHDELGAALVLSGFELEALHRSYAAPAVQRFLRRAVLGPIGHLFGIDYAQSVIATGRRAAGGA